MKKILLCILISFLVADSKAQKMSLDVIGSAPDFNYTTIRDYELPKVASNAIQLKVDTKRKNYQIEFRSDGQIRTSSGQIIPAEKFFLRLQNTFRLIPLSATDDRLLVSRDKDDKDDETYYVDFIVAPLFYDYDPGSYVVNILFTLTSD